MHIWRELLAREGVFLLLLAMIGAGPAAFLSERFDGAARIALAPALGFCLGTAVATTVLQFVPAEHMYGVILGLAIASTALAAWRLWRARSRLRAEASARPIIRDAVQLLIVVLVVAGPLSYTFHEHYTVGPGVYYYADVTSYVSEQDGQLTRSTGDAAAQWVRYARTGARYSDLNQYNWGFRASFNQNLDFGPLASNVDALLGLGSTETYSPFLIAILLAGALGAFAAVRYLTESATPAAVLAGGLFGGAFFLELYYDSYAAAICGLGLVLPLGVLGIEAFRGWRIRDSVLVGLALSAFLTVYPLFVPMLVVTLVICGAAIALYRRRHEQELRALARRAAVRLAVIAGVALAFEPAADVRDIHYAIGILKNTIPLPRVGYHLPLSVLPGWLLQTREFWDMPPLGSADAKQLLLGALLPLAFIAVIVYGIRRYRPTLVLVVLAAVCAIVAEYSFASRQSCTYCAERNLLPIAPVGVALLALGVYALYEASGRRGRWLGMAAALVVVLAVGERARVELKRFADLSYFLDSGNRQVLSKLPRDANSVYIEGYNESLDAQPEEALVYSLADERLRDRVSIALRASDVYNGPGTLVFNLALPPGPELRPDYDYVLTRFAGVQTDRRLVSRAGGFALEKRTAALDVTPLSGFAVPLERIDSSGIPWVQTPTVQFYVIGYTHAAKVWAKLTFEQREPVTVPAQRGVSVAHHSNQLTACVPATGTSPYRLATLSMREAALPGPGQTGTYPLPVPLEGVGLIAMRAVTGSCRP
jgi:hypothetical protein